MSSAQGKITLQIDGSTANTETVAGWEAEVFTLDGAARGAEMAQPAIELDADAVMELELANGTRLLVAAEDAERYLGAAVGRGEGKAGIISVGPALRLSGSHLPAGASREGIGAWVLKALRIYRRGPAGMTALVAAGSFQDAQLEHRNGLYRCVTDGWGLSQVDALPLTTEPALLFIHGTASSTEGSFKGLWADKYLNKLVGTYGARIYAFEHRSLTDSPIANALDLVRTLPKGARLHLVSHSRGGMVGELLARANRVGPEPFTEAEINRFLEHAKRLGREGFEADANRLQQFNQELRTRGIRVERFVRVACPARGTTLASGRLDRWASVMLNLLGKGLDAAGKAVPGLVPAAKGYDLLQNFLLAVVKQRTDARILPGLEAMMPDSPLVSLLNAPEVEIEHPLHVLAGDFQGDGLLPWLGDCLSEVFYGGQTDLVVNTPSMSGGAARREGIWQKPLAGPEVHHLSYFRRDESALPLLKALKGDDSEFERLAGPSQAVISRGGKEPKRKDDAPIVFLLPGIMGSHIQIGKNRVWFDPGSMIAGEMELLTVGAQGATPDGWMDRNYEKLARYLAETHEVRPFSYDWRLSITKAAERFGSELDQAMKDAQARGKPLRIVAHSMGGLVARLALKGRWDKLKAIPGSRLLQLGTPNRGSHSIAAVLMGRDDFVQVIERWFDWKHDMREFLAIVRDFPGVLELLPWPGENGLAIDGVDYFDANTWQDWYGKDQDPRKGKAWVPPLQSPLDAARAAVQELMKAELVPECTLYVAGSSPTPVALRVDGGRVEIGWVSEGDGRVPWKTGIPPGVSVWYTDAVHGDLANHEDAFKAYWELLDSGQTRLLPQTPTGARGATVPMFQARALTAHALYPSEEEVLAAAMGGARPGRHPHAAGVAPATIEVIHGSLASAESPVIIGAYANDSLRGSAKFLDRHLANRMERAYKLGRYPRNPDEAMVFLHPEPGGKPAGAIVVGLGSLGELLPGTLTQALTNGLLEYARVLDQRPSADISALERLEVSSLLVGSGFTGLSVEVGARCLLDALRRANRALDQAGMMSRVARLSVFEEVEGRAIAAVESLRDLVRDSQFTGVATFDGRLRDGEGGYRGRCTASGGQTGLYRVHIIADDTGALRFTLVTDRARNVVSVEPNQRQAVDGLILSATHSTLDQPGLSRALFELLVPNGMKEAVSELRTLMLSVDHQAAAYPWEFMRETDLSGESPLATRIELVRQLASTHGRARVPTVEEKRIFIVGDTESGMIDLPGAREEARGVAECFANADYEVTDLYRATAQQVFDSLFNGHYRFMHLAGHGNVDDKKTGLTGMVLGPNTYLTSAQISKLRRVPEFVFINCCHLGSMAPDTRPRWGELAANLATEFIEMGCKAVIAAGWAVDDQAASAFARAFYNAMFAGASFGEAVRRARAETFAHYPNTNTWGAFQAYGDERYRFPGVDATDAHTQEYVHPSHLIADLDMLSARMKGATQEERELYGKQLEGMEAAARGRDFHHAGVREKLATAWAELGNMDRAIGHYRAALAQEDAGSSLHALEQLANLEIRYGAKLIESKDEIKRKDGEACMQAGFDRLQLILAIGSTAERRSLLGSYWKRRVQALSATGRRRGIKEGLTEMQQAYWDAANESHNRNGVWDYYPLLNALDATFLSAAWGERGPFDARAGQLQALLQAAALDGRRRYAEKREFFHAMAEVEVVRIDALWACYEGRTEACITHPEVLNNLISRYRDLLMRLGSVREQDSAANQLRFLVAMLPADDKGKLVKKALQQLIDGIG